MRNPPPPSEVLTPLPDADCEHPKDGVCEFCQKHQPALGAELFLSEAHTKVCCMLETRNIDGLGDLLSKIDAVDDACTRAYAPHLDGFGRVRCMLLEAARFVSVKQSRQPRLFATVLR